MSALNDKTSLIRLKKDEIIEKWFHSFHLFNDFC